MNKKHKKMASIIAASVIVANNITPITIMADEINKDNMVIEKRSAEENLAILGKIKKVGSKVTFPSANYTKKVTGYEIKTGVPTKYTIGDSEKISEEGLISSKETLTAEDFTNLLRSLELDVSKSDANIEIKTGEEKEGYKYFNGNYYKVLSVDNYVTLDDYNSKVSSESLFGVNGTPIKIESKEENDFIVNLLGEDKIISGEIKLQLSAFRESNIENFKWFDGVEVSVPQGVSHTYTNGLGGAIETLLIIYYDSIRGIEWGDVNSDHNSYKTNTIIAEIDSKGSIIGDTVASGTIQQVIQEVPPTEDVEVEEVNSIDISNGLENAVVKSNRGYILGFKVEAESSTGVKYTYTLNNEEIVNNSETLNFYDKYTVEEVQEILRSMKVESNSTVKLKVTLGNIREGVSYLDTTGHYYEVIESKSGITWGNAKNEATKQNYLDANGYLAVITSEEENELIANHTISSGLGGTKAILLGATDIDSEGNWKWHNGEEFTYTNWSPDSPNGGRNQNWLYTHDKASSKRGKWDDGGLNGKDSPYSAYAVEYGQPNERLPKPTLNTSSEVSIKSESNLNLGDTSFEDNVISFPNAESNFTGVARLNITYGLGYNSDIVTNYTLKGEKKTVKSKVVKTEELTKDEMNEVLSSLTITGKESNKPLSFTVTVDFGQQVYLYNPSNGHYYGIFSAVPSYAKNKQMAESQEYLGEKGYLVTPMSEEEDAFINGIVDSDFWLGIKYDKSKGDLVYDGGHKEGEIVTYEKGWNKRPNESTPHAHANDADAKGLWTYCGSSNGECETPKYTIVEFGGENKMPSPSEVGETMSINVYINDEDEIPSVEEEEINSIDISNGLENAIVESNRGYILGFKVEGVSESDIKYTYTLKNGEEVINTNKVLNFYDKYTVEEVQEILRSMKVESESNINLTVTLGNLEKDMVYVEENNHYYQLKDAKTWGIGEELANNSSYIGYKGYMGSLRTNEIDDAVIDQLQLNNTLWIEIGAKYENGKIVWMDGEEITYNNFNKNQRYPSASNPYVFRVGKGHGTYKTGTWLGYPSKNDGGHKVLIEYGKVDEKLPRPTVNNSSSVFIEFVEYGSIKLGEPVIDNDYATFPNNEVEINSNTVKLQINLKDGYDANEIKYSLNGKLNSIVSPELIIDNLTYSKLKEVMDSLKIKIEENTSLDVEVSLTSNNINETYKDIVTSGDEVSGYAIKNMLDSNIKTTWSPGGGEGKFKMEFQKAKQLKNISFYIEDDNYNSTATMKIRGLKNGQWEDIGSGETLLNNRGGYKALSIDVVEGLYDAIEVHGTESVLWLEVGDIKFNNESKNKLLSKSSLTINADQIENIDLIAEKDKDIIKVSMEGLQDVDYTLYRKDNEDIEYKELTKLESITKHKLFSSKIIYGFEDTEVKDKTSPLMDNYFLYRTREGNVKVEMNAEDIGTSYTYKVDGKDEKGTIVAESDEVTETSNPSGLKGYVYVIDNNKDTEVLGDTINSKEGIFDLKNVEDDAYLHIKAIDNVGNESDTLHIKLIDETYNNKPRLSTAKNKVLNVGDTFDPMDGVTAYDYEDGNLTDEIEYVGHDKVNTNKIGSYEVEYKVSDSKGLVSTEIVTIHIAGTLDLKASNGENKTNLEWSEEKNAKSYRVFRTDADEFDYKELGVYTSNSLEDLMAIDINAPVIESIYEKDAPKEKTKNEETSLIVETKDLSSTYRYFVQALDENGEIINASQIKNAKSKAGIKGFAYIIDDENNTDAPTTVNLNNIDDIQDEVRNNKSKILHIRAIDKNGNVGETVHHLIGGEYETNFIPVIKGVKHLSVLKGQKVNPRDGVTAHDKEDGNITDEILVEHKIDFNKEGKYDVLYTVEDSDGNKRKVKSSATIYKYMNLDTKADLEKNKVVLDWENHKVDNGDVYYEIRKYNKELGAFSVIGKTEDTHFFDEKSSDIKGGRYLGSDKEKLENGNMRITINSKDIGFEGRYQVFARLKNDDTIVGTMIDEKGNDIYKVGSIVGGIKGYSWHLSNIKDDIVDNTIEQESNVLEFDPQGYEWLHVAPIDIYGNKTHTVHMNLKNGDIVVDIENNNPPKLTVEDTEILVGNSINLKSLAKAEDKEDGDLTPYIEANVVGGYDIDFNEIGTHKIKYSVSDFDGAYAEKTITLNIVEPMESIDKENENEFIDIYNREEDWIYVDSKYNPKDYIKVVSSKDGDITENVKYTTNLNTSVVGDYKIYYTVTDSTGRTARFSRLVHVIEKDSIIPPNWSTAGGNNGNKVNVPIIYKPGYVTDDGEVVHGYYDHICIGLGEEVYDTLKTYFKAYDKEDGHITDKLKMIGIVNTIKPGWYGVQFKVTDTDGNTAYKYVSVHVQDFGFENPDGDKPIENPDEGDNENGSNGGGLPEKPEQPEQPPVEEEKPSEPPTGNEDDNNSEDDIYEGEEDNSNEEENPSEGEGDNSNGEENPSEGEGDNSNGEDKPSEGEGDNSNKEDKPSEGGGNNSNKDDNSSEGNGDNLNGENKPSENEEDKLNKGENLSEDSNGKIDNPKTGDISLVVPFFGLVSSLYALLAKIKKKRQ